MAVADWLSEVTPDRREVQVCFDRSLLGRLDDAKAKLVSTAAAPTLGDERTIALRAEIEQLEAEVQEKTRTFVFEGLGWGRWRQLVAQHPPRAEQADVFRRAVELSYLPRGFAEIDVNQETFVPAAMSASCADPELSPQEALKMIEALPTGVVERLWAAVLKVNHGGKDDPFVLAPIGFVEALASGRK